ELREVRSHYERFGGRLKFKHERVIPNPNFSKKVLARQTALRAPHPDHYRSDCWIGTPIINPDGDVFSCHVGKAAAHRDLRHLPYFLGNLHDASFSAIMERAAQRSDYQFLRTHGPRAAATLFVEDPGLASALGCTGFTTECDMCFSTLKTAAGRAALKQHL